MKETCWKAGYDVSRCILMYPVKIHQDTIKIHAGYITIQLGYVSDRNPPKKDRKHPVTPLAVHVRYMVHDRNHDRTLSGGPQP